MITDASSSDSATFETIERYLCTRVSIAAPASRIGDFRYALVGRDFKTLADVAICEGEKLVGLLSVGRLLAAAKLTQRAS